ncbi:hypothetical protein BDZ97DRAFT_1804543 [Flammula alnicola]|nr:hypothetical protein BDZ97DRAFT_1804543 [Flammula alnicola]
MVDPSSNSDACRRFRVGSSILPLVVLPIGWSTSNAEPATPAPPSSSSSSEESPGRKSAEGGLYVLISPNISFICSTVVLSSLTNLTTSVYFSVLWCGLLRCDGS